MTYIDELASEVGRRLPPERRPKKQAQELYRLYALLVLVRGEEVTLKDVHDAWSTWMTAQNPAHPALRPFGELSKAAQREDQPYADAIREVSARRAAAVAAS